MALTVDGSASWLHQGAVLLGVSVPVFRFLTCFVATVPVNWLCRFIPGGPTARHLYATLTGLALSYYSFGPAANLHFLVPILMGYSSMFLARSHCGVITFITAFTFLIGCHVYYMSGDAWKEGGIDCTGALMVLTLKVISSAMNYQDGLLKEDELRPAQKKNRLVYFPSVIEYLGFCLCCGTHLVGPVYEMKDYLEWAEKKGVWSPLAEKKAPSPYVATLRALLQAIVCMGFYTYLAPRIPISTIFEPQYKEWGFWTRWGYQWLSGFTARWKYYFIWSISEAAIIISGFGFSGWKDSKLEWDRAKNVDILGVELAASSSELPLSWNIHVSTWLRYYVYERLSTKGKKAGLMELMVTQVVSAVWHGLYSGYLMFFINSALMIAGSRVIYRWQQAIPEKYFLLKKVGRFLSFFYTTYVLNYSCIGFIVLSVHETLSAHSSLYYSGTLLPIALLILGSFIKPRSASKSRQKKLE